MRRGLVVHWSQACVRLSLCETGIHIGVEVTAVYHCIL